MVRSECRHLGEEIDDEWCHVEARVSCQLTVPAMTNTFHSFADLRSDGNGVGIVTGKISPAQLMVSPRSHRSALPTNRTSIRRGSR